MAGKFKSSTLSKLKVIFELRYRQGHTFLDRCGRTINEIQEYHPEWIIAGNQPSPQGAAMLNHQTGSKFNFSSYKIDLSLDRSVQEGDINEESLKQFADDAEQLSAIVADQLALAEFSRIGCRIWYLIPANTIEEAWSYLDSLKLYQIAPEIGAAFGGKQESTSMSISIVGEDRKFRLSLSTGERNIEVDLGDAVANVPIYMLPSKERLKANLGKLEAGKRRRKFPLFATVIDVDAFRDEPETVKPSEFVQSSFRLANEGLYSLTERAQQ